MSCLKEWLNAKSVQLFGKSDIYNDMYILYIHWRYQQRVESRGQRLLSNLAQGLSYFVAYCCFFCYILIAYRQRKDIMNVSRHISFAMFVILVLIKIHIASAKMKKLEAAMVALNKNLGLEHVGYNEGDQHILNKERRRFTWLCMTCVSFFVCCSVLRLTSNVLDSKTLLPMPFIENELIVFIVLPFDFIGIWHYCFWYVLNEINAGGVMMRIRAHYVILRKNLLKAEEELTSLNMVDRKVSSGVLNQGAVFLFLRKNIKHHQEILKVSRILDDFYWLSSVSSVFAFGGAFVLEYFEVALLSNDKKWGFMLIEGIYALGSILEIILKCVVASEIKSMIHAAGDALYSIPWREMNDSNQKLLNIFSAALKKDTKFTAGRVLGLDLQFLAGFFQVTYGYLAFAQNVARRG